jgi:hypothetical protein
MNYTSSASSPSSLCNPENPEPATAVHLAGLVSGDFSTSDHRHSTAPDQATSSRPAPTTGDHSSGRIERLFFSLSSRGCTAPDLPFPAVFISQASHHSSPLDELRWPAVAVSGKRARIGGEQRPLLSLSSRFVLSLGTAVGGCRDARNACRSSPRAVPSPFLGSVSGETVLIGGKHRRPHCSLSLSLDKVVKNFLSHQMSQLGRDSL